MIKQLTLIKQKLLLLFTLFTLLYAGSYSVHSQTAIGMSISWDREVGCQIYGVDDGRKIFFTDIEQTQCVRVCEFSNVTYTISNLPAGATTTWNATGGITSSMSNTSCTVVWSSVGVGALSFTVSYGSSIIAKTLCIEKILIPTARFEIAPLGQSQPTYTCSNQILNFINLSTTNSGTNLVNYYWDFGDGASSTAFEPTHTYADDGSYVISLTVRNECNCTDVYKIEVIVKSKGFEISCPSVICEGQSQIYSLPFDGMEICHDHFVWSAVGGHILSQQGGNVEVLWDGVDENGFGYLTFDPSHCNLECLEPSTIKIPVIQTHGTIQGPTALCLGKQGRYKLPQWPTTDIHWQIVGNVANNLGEIFQTDQRNEVIVAPYASGILTLRATYTNTLLHCSGEAEFEIQVGIPLEIIGDVALCQNTTTTYSNSQGILANWTLVDNLGALVYSQNNTLDFTYPFSTAGNFILKVSADNYCSGEQKAITVVGVPTSPTGVTGDVFVCPNSPYTYAVQSPDAISDYYWEVTNGSFLGSDTGSQVNVQFNGTFPATVSVYTKTISPITCLSSPFVLTINQLPVDVDLSPNYSTVCGSSLASYQAFASGTTTLYAGGDTYTWSFSNPSLGSVTNGQGTPAIDVIWNNVTTITVVDLLLTVGKCNISPAPQFVKQITLYPKTAIEVVSNFNPVCAGGLYPVTFTVQSTNGVPLVATDQVTWNLGFGEFTTLAGEFTYTTTLDNTSTVTIGQVMTAFIANANGCGVTNTASVTVAVLPNPPGIATLTSSANGFCTESEINAMIMVSSNTTGVSFEWYKNDILIPFEFGTSLHVTYALGFGTYTFQVTNANGCKMISNPIYIVQVCAVPDCTISETVTNTSVLTGCGTIAFSGFHSGTAVSESWQVLGPDPSDYSISGGVLTGKPGNYKIIYKVIYPCQEGGNGYVASIRDVVIPYEPNFSYTVACAENNSFNVNFLDNSTFFAQVSPQNVRFYYKLTGASSFTGPVVYDSSLSVYEMAGLPAGTYVFRQEVDGTCVGTPTYTCAKEYVVNLQGVDPELNIIVNNGQQIKCYNTAVKFELTTEPATGTSVLWDFDDAGAQNTLASPLRVFNLAGHTYHVTCTVTNQYGCSRILTATVVIPEKCFFGDVVATPSSASVCQGQTVTLTYVPNVLHPDICTDSNTYVWMDGNEAVVGAANSSQLTVATTGFYWVKVISIDGCVYDTPTQIKPLFNILPTVRVLGESTFCQNEEIKLTVSTNAPTIQWYVNDSLYPQFDNDTEVLFTGLLPVGNYTVQVVVTSASGCSNTASHIVSIKEAVHDIYFGVHITCDPYQVAITAIPDPNDSDIIYNWSNGESTQTITVSDGGSYRVTATLGGCSYSAEVDVPKNPEDYIWIFPSGCYTDCSTDLNYLIGPTLVLPYWSWNLDGSSDSSGSDSYATPYNLTKDASYTLTVSTGSCELESAPLDYSAVKCDKCKIERVYVKDVVKNDTPYCSYTFTLVVVSNSINPYQITLTDDLNNVLILPSTVTLISGPNYLTFTVIPQSPFLGGSTHWTIQGSVPFHGGYLDCLTDFDVLVPFCQGNSSKAVALEGEKLDQDILRPQLALYPNPAKEFVMLRYTLTSLNATVEIYDVAGRSISKNVLSSFEGELQVPTSSYEAGMYIVVLKQEGVVLAQKKLLIE